MTDFALHPATRLDLATLGKLLADRPRVVLSPEARQQIEAGHTHLRTSYSSDTTPEPTTRLLAYACGTGEEVPAEVVQLLLLLKAHSLSNEHSGVQVAAVQRLLDFYNREMLPVVYQQGATSTEYQIPLAHLSLPLLGLGEVNFQGYRLQAADAMHLFSWSAVALEPGEDLALLSGTHFTLAYGVHTLLRAQRLAHAADVLGALSFEVLGGSRTPFDARLQALRPHTGQAFVAERLRNLLADSELPRPLSAAEQLPYSLCGIPQVHGAVRDALSHVAQVLETECNSITTNLAFFPTDELTLQGGNFHDQPLALVLDYLALTLAELGSMAERRTAQLLHHQPKLAGPASDLQPVQQLTFSLVGQNKQLCAPASLHTVYGSGLADYVSLGANAAIKAKQVLENTEQLFAIELLTAAQRLHTQRPARTTPALEQVLEAFAAKVNPDQPPLAPYLALQAALAFVRTYEWR